MVVFNPTKREIGAKIVYYGPALCGKTTNLQYVHKKLNPKQRGELVSLATKDDRTLFFDFLPLDLGTVKGFKTRFHLYTVPGQVYYVSTRRAVLTGVDGVVFVADSQEEKMAENIESLEDLEKNLRYYGKKIEDIPMILQYNKRDLENISSVEELNEKLNKRNLPYIEASAVTGQGVMETLTMISKAVLESLEDSSKRPRAAPGKVQVPRAPSEPIKRPAPPPSPKPVEEPLVELESEDKVHEIEKLKAERKADIDRLLKQEEAAEEIEELVQEPTELEPSDESAEEVSIDETIELEEPELELTDEPLEFGKVEEEIESETEEVPLEFGEEIEEAEEEPLELEVSEEEIELKEEEGLKLGEVEEEETLTDQVQPEVLKEPLEPVPSVEKVIEEPEKVAPRVKEIEIVSIGDPEKISSSSLKLPLTLKLTEFDKEAKINIIIQLEELISE